MCVDALDGVNPCNGWGPTRHNLMCPKSYISTRALRIRVQIAPDGVLHALVGDAAGDQEVAHAHVPQDVVEGRRAKDRGAGLGQHQLVLLRADAAQHLRPKAIF